ncbi:segregation/condensation protein A [Argonema antarcticum]|uniref:segregation/condensation protein A n=1 Tax=Argonema antarcticum TaxID=2942763 RepID=UPI00201251B1|nr:segregation/condensation protein A [Argonema antarcticum]MCL1472143.1 segregation/condensation protein A [Argonema antarcticum A004/B2]
MTVSQATEAIGPRPDPGETPIAYPAQGGNYAKPTASPFSAIALLIDLAQRGEIDPWDVQVIDAIDRCLSEIAALSSAQQGFGVADLSQSGQAFVDAALLVLLKANTLEKLQSPEDDLDSEADEAWSDGDDWTGTGLPKNLERQLRRRPAAQPPSNRRVTLQELIEQLRLVAAAIEEKPPRARSGDRRSYSQARAQAMRATLELANEETSVEIAAQLVQFLTIYCSGLPAGEDWLDLEQLLVLWPQRRKDEENEVFAIASAASVESEIKDDNSIDPASTSPHPSLQEQLHDRVGIFWALLLLSAQSKVELVQEEFYQDLKMRPLS